MKNCAQTDVHSYKIAVIHGLNGDKQYQFAFCQVFTWNYKIKPNITKHLLMSDKRHLLYIASKTFSVKSRKGLVL